MRKRAPVGKEGSEATPTGVVERLGRPMVVDDFDVGQVREFWKTLERCFPERRVRLVVHRPYSQRPQGPLR